VKVFYSPAYTLSKHDFDTTRKAGWIADSLIHNQISDVELVEPQPLAEADILRVHEANYVEAVRTGEPRSFAESQGFEWDAGLWEMTLVTNGGVLDAARAALDDGVAGSLSSGLHHAKPGYGEGFCTFNGLAIAARTLRDEGAVSRVLILDLDAHCGGGTVRCIANDRGIVHADVSVSSYDGYNAGRRTNAFLAESSNADSYLPNIQYALAWAQEHGPFDLCLYNAGMDPYEGCTVGGLVGIDMQMLAEREQLVFDWCLQQDIPVAFVLAGGYVGSELSELTLVGLHRLTISAARRNARQTQP